MMDDIEEQENNNDIMNVVTMDGQQFDKERFFENQEHKKQALKLLYQMEDFEPTKLLILAVNEDGNFVILSNHVSLAEVNLMLDEAKERILNV